MRNSSAFAEFFEAIVENIDYVIKGKEEAVRLALVCMVAEGHVLIEDVPGVGKTSLAKALAASIDVRLRTASSSRPTSCRPTSPASPSTTEPRRSSTSGQAADLRQHRARPTRSTGHRRRPSRRCSRRWGSVRSRSTARPTALPAPFMVIATQNPIEHEGTYPLPESQLDRFLMRSSMGYPDRAAEIDMLDSHARRDPLPTSAAVIARRRRGDGRGRANGPRGAEPQGYIVDLAEATPAAPEPRAGHVAASALALQRAARAGRGRWSRRT